MAGTVTPLPSHAGGPQLRPPQAITVTHDVTPFESRREELNIWLKRRALANEGRTSRTYVVGHGPRVVGYYTIAAGGVSRDALPRALRHDNPDQIPVVVLGRLATDKNYERRGIGAAMLKEAITRTLSAATEIGVRALLVHAIDQEAASFYLKYDFVPSPIGERTLLLPVETAMRAIAG